MLYDYCFYKLKIRSLKHIHRYFIRQNSLVFTIIKNHDNTLLGYAILNLTEV